MVFSARKSYFLRTFAEDFKLPFNNLFYPRFMERDLATLEITFMGMIMMTALEFITYYGIGFFNGIKWYNPQEFEVNIFGDITNIINHGIYLASQSQILERSPMEIWGYIILNGTDILSVTVVLGYVVQKFFGISSKAR